MPGVILSFLGGWWARLRGRAPRELTTAALRERAPVAAVPDDAPAPTQATVAVNLRTPAPAAESADGVEQSFRETLRLDEADVVTSRATDIALGHRLAEADPGMRERTLATLGELRQIPALQALVQGFLRAMAQSEVTIDEIVQAIENDAALCVRVLGMANSVSVGSEQRIDDLPTALQMLGVVRVRRLAQAVFTLRDAQRMSDGLDWRHLWIHAFATAAIAEELERRLRPGGVACVHLPALLHDVGKIVLSTVAMEEYRQILVAAWNREGRLDELERRRLGVEHREAGEIFARKHQLPAPVIAAIMHHATPEGADTCRFEVALVSLANYLSKAHGLGFSGARLEERDGEFEDLPAWRLLKSELGYAPDPLLLQEELAEFLVKLREELKGLRETA